MKSIWKKASVVAIAVTGLSIVAIAQNGPEMCPRHADGQFCPKDHMQSMERGKFNARGERGEHMGMAAGLMNPRIMLELGLSMDQQAKLKAFHEQNGPVMKGLMQDRQKLEMDLTELLTQIPVSKDRLEKTKLALLANAAKEVDMRIQMTTTFIGLLTQEQKAKFLEIQATREDDDAKDSKVPQAAPQPMPNPDKKAPAAKR